VLLCSASQRHHSSTPLLHVAATAECARSSFSDRPCLPSSAGQTTFRPVVAAAAHSFYCSDRHCDVLVGACPPTSYDLSCDGERPISTSDDQPCSPATRKRRHGDAADVTSPAASDDDEEIRTIFDEVSVTSRAPGNGAAMTSEKRHCAPPARAVVSDCSVLQRPSLNLYKMQVSARCLHAYAAELQRPSGILPPFVDVQDNGSVDDIRVYGSSNIIHMRHLASLV